MDLVLANPPQPGYNILMPFKKMTELRKKKVKRRIPVAPPALEHADKRASEKALPSRRKAKHKKQEPQQQES
jgi:hypothetical protein